jgi:hypothetical protein
MSEPKTYYNLNGTERVMYSPNVAAAMVKEGLLFLEPPVPPVQTVEPTPDDTQDVPVVPTGKARRKSKGDSGVL